MRFFTFRKNMLFMALSMFCTAAFAQKTVTLTKAGELSEKIEAAEKFTITSLTVSGPVNGKDVLFLREMAGRNMDGGKTDGKLATLDLSNAQIVAGGGNYFKRKVGLSPKYYGLAENDVIGFYMFYNCRSLTSVKLPKTAKRIEQNALYDCKELKECTLPESLVEVGGNAFANTALTEVTFPASLTKLYNKAFLNCAALKTLRFSSDPVPVFQSEPFESCSNLEKVFVPENLVDAYKSAMNLPSKVVFMGVATGISSLSSAADAVEVARYNARGQRISTPVKGLNIIKLSDGKVVKRIER